MTSLGDHGPAQSEQTGTAHNRRHLMLALRLYGLSPSAVDEWLAVGTPGWVAVHGPMLMGIGLSADLAQILFQSLEGPALDRVDVLVEALRLADLDPTWLPWWVFSAQPTMVVKRRRQAGQMRDQVTLPREWVSGLRRMVRAAGGDQRRAAMAAATAMEPAAVAAGDPVPDLHLVELRTMLALTGRSAVEAAQAATGDHLRAGRGLRRRG